MHKQYNWFKSKKNWKQANYSLKVELDLLT